MEAGPTKVVIQYLPIDSFYAHTYLHTTTFKKIEKLYFFDSIT